MKIIKIILSIIGVIFLIPLFAVLWIAILGGLFLAKASNEGRNENALVYVGEFATVLVLQFAWLVWVIFPILVTLFGK